jgi:hypothetical protein
VVQHKQSKTLFALKYINKAKCVKMKAVANIVQERRLLEEVSKGRFRLMIDRSPFCGQPEIRVPGRRKLFLRLGSHVRRRSEM